MNKISTLKGFTIPKGYTLTISQSDGSVVEKREGERSGGAYSFEEVASGANPDWELSGAGVQEAPQAAVAPKPEAPKPAKVEAPKTIGIEPHAFERGDFSGVTLQEGVEELLRHSKPAFRRRLSQRLNVEQLSKVSAEALKKDSEFVKHSGYITAGDAVAHINRAMETVDRYAKSPFTSSDMALNALILYDEMPPRSKEWFSNGEAFLKHVVESYGYVEIKTIETVEPIASDNSLPKLVAGEFDEKTFDAIFSKYQNPANVARIFASYTNPNEAELKSVRAEIEALSSAVKASFKSKLGEEIRMDARKMTESLTKLSKLRKRADALGDEEPTKAFRRAINSGGVELEDYLVESPSHYVKRAGARAEAFAGLKFGLNFVHEDLAPHQSMNIEKTKEARAHAGQTTIFITKTTDATTMAHEFGHIVEAQIPSVIVANTMPFLHSRIDPLGEVSVNLREVSSKRYEPHESAFEDDFRDLYTGKIYSHVSSNDARTGGSGGGSTLRDYAQQGGIYATEAVSMGLQYMYDNPFEFAKRDMRHFMFIWSLRSNPKMMVKK